jgi:hypothetical protein
MKLYTDIVLDEEDGTDTKVGLSLVFEDDVLDADRDRMQDFVAEYVRSAVSKIMDKHDEYARGEAEPLDMEDEMKKSVDRVVERRNSDLVETMAETYASGGTGGSGGSDLPASAYEICATCLMPRPRHTRGVGDGGEGVSTTAGGKNLVAVGGISEEMRSLESMSPEDRDEYLRVRLWQLDRENRRLRESLGSD